MVTYRILPFGVVLAFATGCTAIALSTSSDPTPYDGSDAASFTDGGNYLLDASADSATAPPTSPRSPLCAATNAACGPDDTKLVSLASSCGLLPPADAGADAADGGTATYNDRLACRVVYDEKANRTAPQCVLGGDAKDGDPCTQGADCKAGYECVGTPGRCRHYCCEAATCTAMTQANMGKTYFCDIQPESAAVQVKVPVCLVAQPCELLKDKCGAGNTCALVDPNLGTTSCVATGPAQVGEGCEKTHCAGNLNCLGAPGARVCERLCDLTHACSGSQQCSYKFPALKQQNVGICQ